MRNELDARGRQAAANLKDAIANAKLASTPPGTPTRRRLLGAVLRPAWIVALLMLGSAVGVAMVLDSSPPATTLPPATTSTTVITTSTEAAPVVTEPAPPTTAAVIPIAPTTTEARDTKPPILEIISPEDGAELAEKKITFAGVTEPGARVFAGKYEADVDSSGEWHIVLVLSEGKNTARFVARDPAGNESEASVTVFYAVPTTTTTITEPTTSTTEKQPAEFSANAAYGSCSDTPPFDVYYGTGEPGSLVQITSEYGSGSVEVGENGQWEKKVFFETAPADTTFVVHVFDAYGREANFEFIYTP
ncbi:MAG: hypothetical protein WCA93_11245 [Acidimicrobiia bacterium]